MCGCIHPHRAPGFENRKPKHRREDGSFPEVKLLVAEKRECRKALELAGDMRGEGFAVLMDLNQRSLRAQMKYANKLGARYTVVLGDNEVDTDRVQLKAMDTGEETEIALSTFVNGFYSVSMQAQLADLEINGEAFDFTSLFQTGETE